MYYIIQKQTFREYNYENIISTIDRLDLDYEIIDVLPFTDELNFNTDRKDVFVFGALKIARLGKLFGWYPGSLHNDNHDYEIYSQYYKDNLLNYDSIVCDLTDEIDFTERKFIRPTLDTKTYSGRNKKKFIKPKQKYYCSCGNLVSGKDVICQDCHHLKQRKVKNRPSIEQLLCEIKEIGYSATGRKYGVSDNTIRKWTKI